MTKKELEAMVSAVKSPPLDRKQTRKLFEENSNIEFQQNNDNQVVQAKPQRVAQPVAQPVAQASWVAQRVAKQVVQNKPQKVAQNRPLRIKDSEELLIEKDVNKLKDQIFQIQGVDKRKNFVREVGWGIMTERRGKKQYLFGVKKLGGRKYKLYVGNATN